MTETHKALHDALRSRNPEQVDHLLGLGISPCYEDYTENCFHLSLDVEKISFLRKLLELQPTAVNCRDTNGNTLLMRAKRRKYFRLLAKFNPDPDLCNNQGDNVLLNIFKTHANLDKDILCWVLDTGVDVNLTDAQGKTALEYAIDYKSGGGILIEILLDREAIIPPPDENGQTFLMRVVKEFRHFSVHHVLGSLVAYRSEDIFERDNEGRTAMHHAILSHRKINRTTRELVDITKFLFQFGCPLDCIDLKFELFICHGNNFGTMLCILSPDNVANYDIISLFAQNLDVTSLDFMLMIWLSQNKYVQGDSISPVTTFLLNFVTVPMFDEMDLRNDSIAECLKMFLKHDVTLSQHILRFRNETARMWSDELNLPDTLWLYFLMFCRKRCSVQFLHMLLRTTWPHHPLCLLLFPVTTEIWMGAHHQHLDPILMIEALTSFGGPMITDSRLFHAVRGRLESFGPAYKPALEKFFQIHGRVQSLLEMCRTTVRALFAHQVSSGVDLTKLVSELCIPIEVKNYLNFN